MSLSESHLASEVWAPRRRMSLQKARRRSKKVAWMRRLFVTSAAICIGIFSGLLAANAIMKGNETISVKADELVMLNPRFAGLDNAGSPYEITADSAAAHTENDDSVMLYNPRIEDNFGGLITAPNGLYDEEAETLELWGNVVAADPGGYVFSSSRAMVHVNEGRIVGLNPLRGNGPIGEFASKEYEILDDGSHLVMTGDVEITLYPKESDREIARNAGN